MNLRTKQATLLKLAQVKLAANHVLRQRAMRKQAEGKQWTNPNYNSDGTPKGPPKVVDSGMFPGESTVPNIGHSNIPLVNSIWMSNTVPKVKPEYEYILRLGNTIGTEPHTSLETQNKYNVNSLSRGRDFAYGLAEEASKGRLTPEQLQAGLNMLYDTYNGNNAHVSAEFVGKNEVPVRSSIAISGTPVYPLEGVRYSDTSFGDERSMGDMLRRYLTSPGTKSRTWKPDFLSYLMGTQPRTWMRYE